MVEKVSDTAELVTLDGLQGGVPFSDITLSGDIVGQEITLRACGKNLIAYPYRNNSGTINGVDFTVNDDGSVTVNGTATANVNFYLCYDKQMNFPAGRYMMSGCPEGGSLSTYRMEAYSYSDDNKVIFSEKDVGGGVELDLTDDLHFGVRISIFPGVVCNGLIFYPQIEHGNMATAYEPYHSSEVKVTPDSNPYTVPNDIRQQDGINNVSVSAGEVSVTGVNQNKAFKVIYKRGVPANGGNADTVDGKHASDLQPEVIPANSDTSVKTYAENYRSSTGIAYAEFAWRGYHATDAPATNGDFFFKAYKLTSANIRVIAYNLRKNETYEISKYNGTWSEWKRVCDGGNASTANTANTAGTLATTPTNVCLRNISFGTANPQVTNSSAEGYVAEGALYGQYV